jgi:hypothetical protein
MKTDDLIAMLGTNVEPVAKARFGRTIAGAVAAAMLVAIGGVLFTMGLRPDLTGARAIGFLLFKLVFMALVLVPASIFLTRLARPGGERKASIIVLALPFVAVTALGVITLVVTPNSHWTAQVMGDEWIECLVSIPVIAVVPFAAMIWAVRRMAPTDLVRAGALAGLVAGCISAIGYALHCTADSLPFVAVWFGGTIVLCSTAGALLGPRLLRW